MQLLHRKNLFGKVKVRFIPLFTKDFFQHTIDYVYVGGVISFMFFCSWAYLLSTLPKQNCEDYSQIHASDKDIYGESHFSTWKPLVDCTYQPLRVYSYTICVSCIMKNYLHMRCKLLILFSMVHCFYPFYIS